MRDAAIGDVVLRDFRIVIHTESKINPKENIFNLKKTSWIEFFASIFAHEAVLGNKKISYTFF